ncbi:MAG: hypothetical protein MUF10_01505 [Thermoanaerobaculaceae bacterium]|nr:hypothetical protein [Thermoanaerobaculaceae bacterium]
MSHRTHEACRGLLMALLGIGLACLAADAVAGPWRSIGPNGGDVWTIALAPSQPEVVVAGTGFGVFRSDDRGTTWVSAGLAGSEVFSLAIHPDDPDTILAGSVRAIFRSTDRGASWEPARVDMAVYRVLDIAFSPSNPNVAYAATDEGVYVSADGGMSWHASAGFCGGYRRGLTFYVLPHPTEPQTLYATGASAGVCLSRDGGATWTPLDGSGGAGWRARPVMEPGHPNVILAISDIGVVRTQDGGQTWSPTAVDIPLTDWQRITSLAWPASEQAAAFAVRSDGHVFRSTDRGSSWTDVGPGQGGTYLAAGRTGRLFLTGTVDGVFVSDDSGASWQSSSSGLTNVHVAAVADTGAGLVVGGGGMGVFSSQDGGATWRLGRDGLPWSGGYERPWFLPTQLLPSPWRPGSTLAVTTWGLFDSTDLEHWDTVWQVDFLAGLDVTGGAPPVGFAVLEQHDWHNGCSDLLVSTAGGSDWTSPWPANQCLTSGIVGVAADLLAPPRVYLAQSGGRLLRSDDSGVTVQSCGPMVPPETWGPWTYAVSTRVVAGELWAFTEAGIFHSADGCQSWQPLSPTLTEAVLTAVPHPDRPNLVFAGARQGVLVSHDRGATWAALASHPDVIQVRALAFSQDGRTLYAGTEGRGVFALDLGPSAPKIRRRLSPPAGTATGRHHDAPPPDLTRRSAR